MEVTEVVKQLHSGKAPGVDEIRPEMLKAMGVEGLSWMTRLFNIAWKSGTVPKEVFQPCLEDKDLAFCLNEGECSIIQTVAGVHRHCR